jgi:hypothetical protein
MGESWVKLSATWLAWGAQDSLVSPKIHPLRVKHEITVSALNIYIKNNSLSYSLLSPLYTRDPLFWPDRVCTRGGGVKGETWNGSFPANVAHDTRGKGHHSLHSWFQRRLDTAGPNTWPQWRSPRLLGAQTIAHDSNRPAWATEKRPYMPGSFRPRSHRRPCLAPVAFLTLLGLVAESDPTIALGQTSGLRAYPNHILEALIQ